MAESGALLRRCTSKGYRGFESLPLRRHGCRVAPSAGTHGRRDVRVPIAQLDRALDCGSKGRRFESSWARKRPVQKGPGAVCDLERCESGRIGRSRKPLSRLRLRGFESPSLREIFFSARAQGRDQSLVSAWRDDRVAEGARLEGVCTRKGTVGSNPTLSVQPLWR